MLSQNSSGLQPSGPLNVASVGNRLVKGGLGKASLNVFNKQKAGGLKVGGGVHKPSKSLGKSRQQSSGLKEFKDNSFGTVETITEQPASSEMEVDDTEALQKEVKEMRETLNQTVEKTKYWKRKSMGLLDQLNTHKKDSTAKISKMEGQVVNLTEESGNLRSQLEKANKDNVALVDAIVKTLEGHQDLAAAKEALVTEIKMLKEIRSEKPEELQQSSADMITELSGELRTSLDDLQELMAENELVKKKLGAATEAKEALESQAMCTDLGNSKDPAVVAACKRLLATEKELEAIDAQFGKLVYKCAVLSETNKALKAEVEAQGVELPASIEEVLLQTEEKYGNLEVERYQKLLEAAKEVSPDEVAADEEMN